MSSHFIGRPGSVTSSSTKIPKILKSFVDTSMRVPSLKTSKKQTNRNLLSTHFP